MNGTRADRPRRRRAPSAHSSGAAPVLALLACALASAGCGDDDGDTAASAPPAAATQAAAAAGSDAPDDPSRTGGWRLRGSTSPYLRAHADNPVEWYPWGEEAFARARELDRPVFLSIGYSACHWCHVMERGAFQDEECVRRLDEGFVAVKVDREERPDVDARYLRALQVITGGGGWPASLFLTPDGEPFAGGTYFPARAEGGLPGFADVLDRVLAIWRDERGEVLAAGARMGDFLRGDALPEAEWEGEPARVLDEAATAVFSGLDTTQGGFHGAPKFPPSVALRFLMRQHVRTGIGVLPGLRASLAAMAEGGLRDHVGGGFHRYCVDAEWRLPHFEKMLEDNALLLAVYAEAAALTGEARWAGEARATFGFLRREMRTVSGLYACSLDADSLPAGALPGAAPQEGAFYTWTGPELRAELGERDGALVGLALGVPQDGSAGEGALPAGAPVEPRVVLQPRAPVAALAPQLGVEPGEARAWLDERLETLRRARERRPRPARDEQCEAVGNGLLLSGLARAGRLLGDGAMIEEARSLATALLRAGRVETGATPAQGLPHLWAQGRAVGQADLLDHAALGLGLLDAFEALGDPALLLEARALAGAILARFAHPDGGFYDTAGDDPLLPGRGRDVQDGMAPAGSALALELLLRLAPLDDEGRLDAAARAALARLGPVAARSPEACVGLLGALDIALGPLAEVVIDGASPAREALAETAQRTLLPAALIVPDAGALAAALEAAGERPTLLEGRRAPAGEARAWVCVRGACLLPASDPAALAAQLAEVLRRR